MQSDYQPRYCYADRMDTLECISDEDAIQMGLFSYPHVIYDRDRGFVVEFLGDVRWNPFTGTAMVPPEDEYTLSELQDSIMEKVWP